MKEIVLTLAVIFIPIIIIVLLAYDDSRHIKCWGCKKIIYPWQKKTDTYHRTIIGKHYWHLKCYWDYSGLYIMKGEK